MGSIAGVMSPVRWFVNWSYDDFSRLIIHGVPNRSTSIPNRRTQKVSSNGICTVPPSASALKIRSVRATALRPMETCRPFWLVTRPSSAPRLVRRPATHHLLRFAPRRECSFELPPPGGGQPQPALPPISRRSHVQPALLRHERGPSRESRALEYQRIRQSPDGRRTLQRQRCERRELCGAEAMRAEFLLVDPRHRARPAPGSQTEAVLCG